MTEIRRARIAVAAMFFTNGVLFANILPRYPEIKDMFELSNSAYGFTIALFPVGAIAAGLASATLVRRFGSARVATTGMILTSIALVLAGSSPSVALFGIMLFLAGGLDAVSDVGQNAHAMVVQQAYGRSIINSFHAIWSIGAVTGGGMSALAIALDLPLPLHLGIVTVIFSVVCLFAQANSLPGRDPVADEEHVADSEEMKASIGVVKPRVVWMLAALVLISIAGSIIEEIGNSWAALYMTDFLNTPEAIAAFGYISLVGGQFIGRILGDRQVDRWGNRRVAFVGGLVGAVGAGLALAFPSVPGTLIGFAAAGYGCATIVPSAFDRADKLPGLQEGTGITMISWLMRLGFLGTPPLIGFIADSTSIRTGLILLPIAGLLIALLSVVLPTKEKDSVKSPKPANRSGS